MRPERLEVEGFTAFRETVAVDFDGTDLFAFTGPTGSGKSSLIDAMTFALYGSIPRGSGTNQTGEFLDTTPAPGATYQYRLVPVAANHDPISLPSTELSLDAWRGCPETTTTVLRGSVAEDWGWTVALAPCAESCYPRAYIEGPPSLVAELRAFLGTGQAFDFFGGVGCGGVEGCGLTVDSYAPAACGSTPSRTTTWGELKASYR